MTGDVADLDAHRARRGLPAAPQTVRPTIAQATRIYGADVFAGAVLMGGAGIVAHQPHDQHRSACGVPGDARPAPSTALVCLRCWPWWHA